MNHRQVKVTTARDGAVVSDALRRLCRVSSSTEGLIYQTEVYVPTEVPLGACSGFSLIIFARRLQSFEPFKTGIEMG